MEGKKYVFRKKQRSTLCGVSYYNCRYHYGDVTTSNNAYALWCLMWYNSLNNEGADAYKLSVPDKSCARLSQWTNNNWKPLLEATKKWQREVPARRSQAWLSDVASASGRHSAVMVAGWICEDLDQVWCECKNYALNRSQFGGQEGPRYGKSAR